MNQYHSSRRYVNIITGKTRDTPPPACRGGLLADQMGLGKSLSMISLMASNPRPASNLDIDDVVNPMPNVKATLLVVPLPHKSLLSIILAVSPDISQAFSASYMANPTPEVGQDAIYIRHYLTFKKAPQTEDSLLVYVPWSKEESS